jgi:peptidoglycan/xylan/chitin deacetylase (PgdA/CDA1 family)
MSRQVLILAYHHVGTPPPGFRRRKLWVTPGLLALHARVVRRLGYELTTVSDAVAGASGKLACITFDDGFADVVELGYPALRALGARATMFVVTDEVGRRSVAFAEDEGTVPSDMATWDALRAVAAAGWEIGSHSSVHRRLARLPLEEQRALLARSRRAIAREIGAPPRSVAYPYGSCSAETVAVARNAGFLCGVTTERGLVLRGADPMRLPRLTIGGHRPFHAARMLKILLAHARLLPLPHRREAMRR